MGGRPALCPAGAAPLRDPGKARLSNQNRVCLARAPGSRTLLVEKTIGFLKTLSSSDSAPKPPSSSSLPEVFPDPPSSGRGWVSGRRVGEGGGKGTKERAEAGVAVPGGDRQGRPSCGHCSSHQVVASLFHQTPGHTCSGSLRGTPGPEDPGPMLPVRGWTGGISPQKAAWGGHTSPPSTWSSPSPQG